MTPPGGLCCGGSKPPPYSGVRLGCRITSYLYPVPRAEVLVSLREINYLWIRPEPSPPASFSTSGTVTMRDKR